VDEQIPSSRFVYYPTAEGKTKALRTWFAPGTPYGQDIVYPKNRAAELAVAVKEDVVSIPETTQEAEYKTVPYATVTREGTEVEYKAPEILVAQNTVPPPAVAPAKSLPRTGSAVPLAALLGAMAVGAALALRSARLA
jgi:hypothetical protein